MACVDGGLCLCAQEQRVQIKREFSQWLTGCHERLDKQVHFVGFKETITRAEMQSKKMQYPWATFSSIEWDNKTFKTGQLVGVTFNFLYCPSKCRQNYIEAW